MIDLLMVGRRMIVFMGIFAYIAVLHLTYVEIISPSFLYLGYGYNEPVFSLLITVWGMAIIPSLWMPIRSERPSQLVYWLLYVFVFVPAMIIPLYTIQIPLKYLLNFDLVLLLCFFFLGVIYKLPLLVLPRIRISPFLFWSGLFLVSLFFYGYIIKLFGFQFRLVSFLDVYEVRAEYGVALNDGGAYASYIIDWISLVINPFLIVFGLTRKKWALVLIGILGQVMVYSFSGNRTIILSSIYLLLLLLCLRKGGRSFGIYISWGLTGMVMVSCLADILAHSNWATSLFVRRLIITPGLLTGYYVDFFSEHPKTLLAHSILKGMFQYPYPFTPPEMIGYFYWGSPKISANANVWADAYANFGIWGIIIFTFFLGLLLWLYDCFSTGRNQLVTTMVLALPALTLVDGALLTAIGNHGLGFALLVIYFLPEKQDDYKQNIEEQEGSSG